MIDQVNDDVGFCDDDDQDHVNDDDDKNVIGKTGNNWATLFLNDNLDRVVIGVGD